MAQQTPTVFGGRYELHRRLARGGMADVFLARDQLLGRPVALKVLFAEYASDPKFVERFRREAQNAASLNHPSIVAIYDWGEESGTYYIVMEYVDGQSLAQILDRDGRLSIEQVTRVAIDVAAALGFAHDGGVVHRDVKPGNVLVNPKGEMKVADFGIATALISNAEENLTQTGSVMGTATYFSPEQAQGFQVDHRSDLYSLGVVIYEMLTGKPPFKGETPVSIAYKHVQEPVPPIDKHGVEIPPALAAITMKLLSKNPANRYPSADALLSDLNRFRQGQAMAHGAPGAGAALTTAALPGVNQTAALPPAQVGTHTPSPAANRRLIDDDYRPAPRRRIGLAIFGLLTGLLILAGFGVLMQSNFGFLNLERLGIGTAEPTPVQTDQTDVATQIEIPIIAGRGQADAQSVLEAKGFTVAIRKEASNDVTAGNVIYTEPASGTAVSAGSTITMVVSSGANLVQVPSVTTQSQNDALSDLVTAGFKPRVVSENSDIAPEGEVTSQEPAAGQLAELGSTVTITVSAGIAQEVVPDVRGQELAAAQAALREAGFVPAELFERMYDSEIPDGLVIGTDPAADTKLAPGTQIRLIVSKGTEAVVLPSVVGMHKDVAFTELQKLGIGVSGQYGRFVSDPALHDVVIDTVPPPNSTIPGGTQIEFWVGIYQTPTGTDYGFGQHDNDPDAGQGTGHDG